MKKPKWNSEFGNYVERQKKVVIARTEGTCLHAEVPRQRNCKVRVSTRKRGNLMRLLQFVRNDILGVPTYL